MAITNLSESRGQIPEGAEAVVDNFNAITDLVRPSGNEVQMTQFLVDWARTQPKITEVREIEGVIVMNVAATLGYENAPRTALQGHTDMVTIGGNDTNPTEAVIEDGWIKSNGKTTLGADNGIGVAMVMALVEDETLQHGPLTLIFTPDEERGMTGAFALKPESVPKDLQFFINTDSEEGAQYVCRGCAGGSNIIAAFEVGKRQELPADYTVVELKLGVEEGDKLRGGHSGVDIHERRGNAILEMNQFLLETNTHVQARNPEGLKLLDIQGGTATNVIPSTATCKIAVPTDMLEEVVTRVEEYEAQLKAGNSEATDLTAENAANIIFTSEVVVSSDILAVSNEVRDSLLEAVSEIPNGPFEFEDNPVYGGGVLLSNNTGTLNVVNGLIRVGSAARGADMGKMRGKAEEIRARLAERATDASIGGEYPGWYEKDDSRLLQVAKDAVAAALGQEAQPISYHAGLENGLIVGGLDPNGDRISSVSVGPLIHGAHKTNEAVSLSSIGETNKVVRAMLTAISELDAA